MRDSVGNASFGKNFSVLSVFSVPSVLRAVESDDRYSKWR